MQKYLKNRSKKFKTEKHLLLKKQSNKNSFEKPEYYIKNKFILLVFIIIIIILSILVLHLYRRLNKAKLFIKIFKVLKNEKDVDLFLNNKTDFYFQKRVKYLSKNGFYYNESNLKTFQEKLNYLMIHESPEYKTDIADKIKVHEYSKKVLGKDICPPILKIYDNADEINLDELPDKFALKCNHGSSMNIFCVDKSKFNLEKAKSQLNDWVNTNYGLNNREFQYIFIKKKIFAAPYLGDNIIDYEIYCFNGKPKFVRVRQLLNQIRHISLHNYYDFDWKLMELETGLPNYKRDPNKKIEKPKNLNLMIEYSKKLTKDFVFVRVDFYELNNTVYLSEITFSPSNTLMKLGNEEQRLNLGSLLDITKIKKSLFNK